MGPKSNKEYFDQQHPEAQRDESGDGSGAPGLGQAKEQQESPESGKDSSEHSPAYPLILHFSPLDCFKSPRLWKLVTVVPGN